MSLWPPETQSTFSAGGVKVKVSGTPITTFFMLHGSTMCSVDEPDSKSRNSGHADPHLSLQFPRPVISQDEESYRVLREDAATSQAACTAKCHPLQRGNKLPSQ
ncbi:hypothetical protein DPEC_G00012030 [Dallia pectoralis]|uniref:Uncharacterized protein n=1 Tax=Dallia pectoralis TaxID=75939 RepID=A0ACC2HLI3_DALPE|nr:hypothetical protein DPEC_G00012030 [Dallia pectoralis]